MARPRKVPAYLRHKGADGRLRARTVIDGHEHSLGPYGSPESYQKYERLLTEWRARQAEGGPTPGRRVGTVGELVLAFWGHAAQHRTPKEQAHFRHAIRPLLDLYRDLPVREFGPLCLRAVRTRMLETLGWSVRVCNRQTTRVKTLFNWAAGEELIPGEVAHALRFVKALPRPANSEVLPVPEADLQATLPELPPVVRAMAQVQLLTGMRPGEVIRLRPCELRRDGPGNCWIWEPGQHKNAWRGHKRVVLFGPQAQAVLVPLIEGRDPEAFVFSPAESVRGWRAAQRQARKTPVQPSQRDRSKRRPKKAPGACYSVWSYRQAVHRACKRAGVRPWCPLMLRHNAASRLAAEFSPEIARIVLGHRSLDVTRVYVRDSLERAAQRSGGPLQRIAFTCAILWRGPPERWARRGSVRPSKYFSSSCQACLTR